MTLFLIILASARLVRLIVWDKITQPLRGYAVKVTGVGSWLAYLLHCIYCTGFWAPLLIIAPYLVWGMTPWLFTCCLILAVAEAAPHLLELAPSSNTGGE